MKKAEKKNKSEKAQKFIWWFVFVSLLISDIYLVVELIFLNGGRLQSGKILMLSQCTLGTAAMFLPWFIERKMHLMIPPYMKIIYTLFLYGAIFLGEVRSFYYVVSAWDMVLHLISGIMLTFIGFSAINFLNESENTIINMCPAFVAIFALCFGISLGVVWEFYEFICDGLLGTNMQKFALESGKILSGRDAVSDTMKDLIVDFFGAFIASVAGYISLKFDKGWLQKLLLRKK